MGRIIYKKSRQMAGLGYILHLTTVSVCRVGRSIEGISHAAGADRFSVTEMERDFNGVG